MAPPSTSIFRPPQSHGNLGKTHTFSEETQHLLYKSLHHCWADSTASGYSSTINNFLGFCDRESVPQNLRFPTDEFVLCAFVASKAGTISGSSARNTLSALKAWHNFHGTEWKGGMRLHLVLNGVKNLSPESSHRPPQPPINSFMLSALVGQLDLNSGFDLAVAACAAVAFWGQCRLGELIPRSTTSNTSNSHPRRIHLRDPSATSSATLFLPCTKTNRKGETISLPNQSDPINPLTLLQRHLRYNRIPDSSPLFAYRTPSGLRPLTKHTFLRRCNDIWSRLGYPRTTGHSFRIGGTTELLLSGVPTDIVKAMGRWHSSAFLRYWRQLETIAPLYAENVTRPTVKRKRGRGA